MNRTALLKRAGSILLHTPSLWIVTLIGTLVSTAASGVLVDQSLGIIIGRVLLAFIITAFTHGALISMVNTIANDQRITLGFSIQSGFRWLAILILIEFALMIPTWIVLYIASGSLLTTFLIDLGQPGGLQANSVLNYAGSILSLAGLAIAFNLAASALGIGIERSIIIEKRSALEAFKWGGQLLRNKLMDFIAFAGILFLIEIGIGFVLSLAGQQVLSSMGINLTDPNSQIDPIILFSNPIGVVLLAVQIITATFLTIFASTVWTLAYREWQNPTPIEAKPDDKRAVKKKG
jgi:hypothetical protein